MPELDHYTVLKYYQIDTSDGYTTPVAATSLSVINGWLCVTDDNEQRVRYSPNYAQRVVSLTKEQYDEAMAELAQQEDENGED